MYRVPLVQGEERDEAERQLSDAAYGGADNADELDSDEDEPV